MKSTELELLKPIDNAIVAASKDIKVLTRLSWPAKVKRTFLDDWQRGNPRLPHVEYNISDDLKASVKSLRKAKQELSVFDHPLASYLHKTADSYQTLCHLLQSAGSQDMLEPSRELYGAPGDLLADGRFNNLQAAHHFLESSDQFSRATHLHESDYCLPAATIKTDLENRLTEVFPKGLLSVVTDPNLVSKAAAGATRIRLRDATCFTEYDLEQLLQHEIFIHSLTALNGQAQQNASCFGLGAPRTTGAQEGLATFSELVTGSIDIDRLERIALRTIAIDHALNGADFIQVFKFFLERGQPEDECFNSTMRIFRGAPVTGGAAFTKDGVYLHGLMQVHTFFSWAMSHQKLDLCRYFLAGRMTISDAIELEPLFNDGTLKQPRYLPPWMAKTSALAGYLAFSVFADKLSIQGLAADHDFQRFEV
ncbi:MAG: hypothetical protein ACJAYF_000381 [Arenicella sp.]|jgi:uncharacterized protein (TIGR02421 family)